MDSNDLKHLQELQKEHPDKVKKVVLEGDEETTINHIHATGRKRRGG